MQELYERCAGLDVHQKNVVVCVMTGCGDKIKKEVRTFSTMTEDLMALGNWLKGYGIKSVVMESTGVYWVPVYNILDVEMGVEIILANACHVKNVPGRKTDVKDCEWLCRLLKNGLVKPSFIPSVDIRDFRRLMRYRHDLVNDLSAVKNRIIKNLEMMNIKISSVLSSVFGASGRNIINAIIQGETDPERLSTLVVGNIKTPKPEIRKALTGRLRKQDITILKLLMQNVDNLEALITNVDQEINENAKKYTTEIEFLDEIPGISNLTAQTVISEIGTNMDKFPTAEHFTSWIGIAPGNNESAGKKKVLE